LSPQAANTSCATGSTAPAATPDHDRLTGNVTVEFALESFAGGRGPGAGVARVALTQLAKGH
jgi:conjugal transfer pilus assembly protein TrbC